MPRGFCCRKKGVVSRYSHLVIAFIIRQTMDPDKTYYMRVKSVLDSEQKEFYMDYMEYCPKEVYDNPEMPEDIW